MRKIKPKQFVPLTAIFLSLIYSFGCIPRPGWSSEEVSMYFDYAYRNYLDKNHNREIPETAEEAVKILRAGGFLDHEKYNQKFIRNDTPVDMWGRPLRFIKEGRHLGYNEEELTVYFYSFGKNGIDEDMFGDDRPARRRPEESKAK